MKGRLAAALCFCFWFALAQEVARPRIMRPVDMALVPAGAVEIIAAAEDGSLEIDGKPVDAERPFPGVLRARPELSDGPHKIAVAGRDGRSEIRIHAGAGAPADFRPFREHPPQTSVPCTQCHEVSRRGRFRFKGGCFDCHRQSEFAKVHTHVPDALSQCGMCHNAHGSSAKGHLTLSKEAACRLCHN
jgi:predicted CXXCH cytochrome family protein